MKPHGDPEAALLGEAGDAGRQPFSPFRLAWRVLTDASTVLPRFLTLSDDLPDAAAVRERARTNAANAFGAEFRVTCKTGAPVYTTAAAIDSWDPARVPFPPSCATTWERACAVEAKTAELRLALRLALETGVADGLLSDADALGLRRAADVIVSEYLAY